MIIIVVIFLEMSRSWMYGDRRELTFQKGVTEFCKAALEHQKVVNEPTIFCPCRDCCNVKSWVDISKIEDHLYRRGFRSDYETWYWHGEKLVFRDDKIDNNEAEVGANPCEGNENVEDDNGGIEEDQTDDMMDENVEDDNGGAIH